MILLFLWGQLFADPNYINFIELHIDLRTCKH